MLAALFGGGQLSKDRDRNPAAYPTFRNIEGAEIRKQNEGRNLPCCFALCIAHHPIRVRACRAAVGVLVVLIERIGSPEDPIAVGTRIALISLVELVLVSFPVKLALESNVTKGAPVCALRFGSAPVVALYGRRRRRGKRRNILSSCCLRRDGAHGGCRR